LGLRNVDHVTIGYSIGHFSIGSHLEQSPLGSKRIRSRVWPFRFAWRYRSRGHFVPRKPVTIGGPLEPSLYL